MLVVLKPVFLIAGLICIIGLLFKGKLGVVVGAIIVTAGVYYILEKDQMLQLGQAVCNILTITSTTQ